MSNEQLLDQAADALRRMTLVLRVSVRMGRLRPKGCKRLLREARLLHGAVQELERRCIGVPPPKVG